MLNQYGSASETLTVALADLPAWLEVDGAGEAHCAASFHLAGNCHLAPRARHHPPTLCPTHDNRLGDFYSVQVQDKPWENDNIYR